MISRKSPKANLGNYRKLFLLFGLVAALTIVYILLERKTYEQMSGEIIEKAVYDIDEETEVPETKVEVEPPKKTAPVTPEPILENIEIIDDKKEIEESVIETTETEATDAVVIQDIDYSEIIEEEVIEEEVVEDVPFYVIERVPVYPGCTGNNEQLRTCMEKNIQKHVAKNFNIGLAQDLGLPAGRNRIFVIFVIDKNGKISNIQSRAPHKSLKKEAERIVKLLPKMKPGEQRGRAVGVKYSLPIVFEIK